MLKKKSAKQELTLPTEKTKPKTELSDFSILLYGEPKIGKTTLAAQFPDALLLLFEPGAKNLSVFARDVPTWEDFLGYLKLLKHDIGFKHVIIDTVDLMYKRCFDYCCKKYGFEHPQEENDFGRSWGKIRDEFTRGIVGLIQLDKGVIFISHAEEKELKTRGGRKYNKIVPTASKQGRTVIEGLVDVQFYYEYTTDGDSERKRRLIVEGSELITAGCRIENCFIDSETGEKLSEIPMGNSPSEAYHNLISSFNNEFTLVKKKSGLKLKKSTK